MHTGPSLRSSWVFALVAVLLVLGSGGFAVAQPLQPLPTEDDGPPVIDQPIKVQLPTAVPTRPPRVTPTPIPTTPPRRTPVPTTEPIDPQPTVVVQPTVPQPPLQPQPPGEGDTLPGTLPPLQAEPWIPGEHNRFEITLYACPAGIDPASDEAAFLAACALHIDSPPGDIAFQLRDGDQTHIRYDSDDDGVFVFDDITIIPGSLFFIAEEFNPGYGDPAVFCGEGSNAQARMPTDYRVIRPQLSTFSNVEYTCAWFKLPLQGDTVRVHDLLCPRDPGAGAGFLWHWQNCQPTDAGSASTFTLTDAGGAHAALTVDGEAAWTNVDFGAAGTVDLARLVATGTLPYRVFCGDFNSGTLMAEVNGAVTVARSGHAPPVEYTCRWFRYLADSDFDDSIQAPATLNAVVHFCPAGQDRDAGINALFLACTEPGPDVDVAMVYPGGVLAIVSTTGANPATAFFGLIGEGNAGATSEVPSGYAAPEVYCRLEIVQGWTNLGNGVNSSVALHFTWGQVSTCAWFHFPAE